MIFIVLLDYWMVCYVFFDYLFDYFGKTPFPLYLTIGVNLGFILLGTSYLVIIILSSSPHAIRRYFAKK